MVCHTASLWNSRGTGMWYVTIKNAVTVIGIATHKPGERLMEYLKYICYIL